MENQLTLSGQLIAGTIASYEIFNQAIPDGQKRFMEIKVVAKTAALEFARFWKEVRVNNDGGSITVTSVDIVADSLDAALAGMSLNLSGSSGNFITSVGEPTVPVDLYIGGFIKWNNF